jgi:hypothetical protein
MSYVCNAEALAGGDLDGDGVLDEAEFLAYLAGASGDDASCDTTSFDFATVGCQCRYFGAEEYDDDVSAQQLPLDCEDDCSAVPVTEMYVASDFPARICAAVMKFYVGQGCISTPTASPTRSRAPTTRPKRRPIAGPIVETKTIAAGNNTTTVAILATVVALLATGAALQFLHGRRARQGYEAQIQTQKEHIEKERKKKEKEWLAKQKRKRGGKMPFRPVLPGLEEGEDGALVLTPTNAPREAALLRCKLTQPGRKFPSTFFATSVTIESVDGGQVADDAGEREEAVEEARLLE